MNDTIDAAGQPAARRVRLSRRTTIGALVAMTGLTLGVLIAGMSGSARAGEARAGDAKDAEIHIDNFAFTPAELTVAPGTTVKWTNRDDIPHTVLETGATFKSKVMDSDESYSFTFEKPGSYEYFCSLHPHMTGKVVVKAP